ncbi:MAG: pyridoxal-phosphate dependent enzyme [Sumerlaeia bacterium]
MSSRRYEPLPLPKDPARSGANSEHAARRQIVLPTFEQMMDPRGTVPESITQRLAQVGLWDIDPVNLFRITWHNEMKEHGGGFGPVNFIEIPREITGVKARIFGLVGKWFPTGAHKVGSAYGCLAPRLVTGEFDPAKQKAVWPSTGNFCRGGAFVSALLACDAIGILPEEMSRERFEWLRNIAGEVIATPGCESNVKEIYDKCHELEATRGDDIQIFNQFKEFGNYLWHHEVTGRALEEAFNALARPGDRLAAYVACTGSGGALAAGDYLKGLEPTLKIAAGEAIQCPTLLLNGFGGHRIEGIGDKHVPWIHNVRNTDFVTAIDDEATVQIMRLFNEPEGRAYLVDKCGADPEIVERLDEIALSCIANMLGAIKLAKWYELGENDVVATVFTDSMALYGSRLEEETAKRGAFDHAAAAATYARYLMGENTSGCLELTYPERKRVHNLKYYTWIEQQGKTAEELNAQWYDADYWTGIPRQRTELDRLITEFNEKSGVLAGAGAV